MLPEHMKVNTLYGNRVDHSTTEAQKETKLG